MIYRKSKHYEDAILVDKTTFDILSPIYSLGDWQANSKEEGYTAVHLWWFRNHLHLLPGIISVFYGDKIKKMFDEEQTY